LFELAAETLVEHSYQQAERGSIYSQSGVLATDYRSCLYALFAWCCEWRRAAQAMDMRFRTATFPTDVSSSNDEDGNMRRVEDISLSLLAAAHSLRLVESKQEQYLVSGEHGPYPIPSALSNQPPSRTSHVPMQAKRTRDGDLSQQADEIVQSQTSTRSSRMSNFMTTITLTKRAVRAIALRVLARDKLGTIDFQMLDRLMDLEATDTDREIIDTLSGLGYYDLALGVAKVMREEMLERTGSCQPNGRDVYYDSVSHIICNYLVPTTRNLSSREEIAARPTIQQINSSASAIQDGAELRSCMFVGGSLRSKEPFMDSTRRAACMGLLCALTVAEARPTNKVGIEVAEALLGNAADIPKWLKDMLLGSEQDPVQGLFAPTKRRNVERDWQITADPMSLLKLYMKNGLLDKACEVVTIVLSRNNSGNPQYQTNRLPERGNVDFIPYQLLDMLWNMIGNLDINDPVNRELFEARSAMERSLRNHLNLMNSSELGLQSARALSRLP